MRLYINTKEIPTLKKALRSVTRCELTDEEEQQIFSLYERVELCESLQNNVKKSVDSVE